MRSGVGGREKRPAGLLRETQRALPGFVVNHQEKIYFARRARGAVLLLRRFAFGALHEHATPPVGCGIAERAEQRLAGFGVLRPGAERQRRLKREAFGVFEPGLVIFERRARPAFRGTRPQAADQGGGPGEIDIDQCFGITHVVLFGLRDVRMRLGRCSSSTARPVAS